MSNLVTRFNSGQTSALLNIGLLLLFTGFVWVNVGWGFQGNYLAAALPFALCTFLGLRLTIPQLFVTIFWLDFIPRLISHKVFQEQVFSLDKYGVSIYSLWFVDYLILIVCLKLLLMPKYSQKMTKFILVFVGIIGISIVANSLSPVRTILAIRSNYIFIILLFVVYVYEFSDSFYRLFFKRFWQLALISTGFSFLSMLWMGVGVSGDPNGGIFGLKGTGIGIIFAISMAMLFLHYYYITRDRKYLLYSAICIFFTVTAKAYFGFLLLPACLGIFFIQRFDFRVGLTNAIAMSGLFAALLVFAIYVLPEDEVDKVYNRLTSSEEIIKYDASGKTGFGRIGSVIFAVNSIQASPTKLIFGYGPGVITYRGRTTAIRNTFLEKSRIHSIVPALGFIYEFGMLGFGIILYFVYRMSRKVKLIGRVPTALERAYVDNMPILLFIYFVSIFYTDVFQVYFHMLFLGLCLSYVNKTVNRQMQARRKEKIPEPA